uniref:Uncharacterized protein n=1 Tax=Romanomermis culicivorax TaxID=13658 RepID=A0A915KX77_ROMCU
MGISPVIHIHPVDNLKFAMGVSRPEANQPALLYVTNSNLNNQFRFVFVTKTHFMIQLDKYPKLVLQPKAGTLGESRELIFGIKKDQPEDWNQLFHVTGKHIRPVKASHLALGLTQAPNANGRIVFAKYDPNAKLQFWQVSKPGQAQLIDLIPFLFDTTGVNPSPGPIGFVQRDEKNRKIYIHSVLHPTSVFHVPNPTTGAQLQLRPKNVDD